MNRKKDIENYTKVLSEVMFGLEKACRLKETLFCNSYNITPMEFRCIRHLLAHCFLSVKDFSIEMNLSPPRVTHLFNKIEKEGFLERKWDNRDRRIMKVSLSDKGMDFAKKVYDEYMLFHGEILDFMNSEEISSTILYLQKFHKSLTHFLENKQVGG